MDEATGTTVAVVGPIVVVVMSDVDFGMWYEKCVCYFGLVCCDFDHFAAKSRTVPF